MSGSGQRLVEYTDTFQYVPLRENLEKFLNHTDIFKEVHLH